METRATKVHEPVIAKAVGTAPIQIRPLVVIVFFSSSHSLCRCGPEHCQQTASRTCNCREIVNNLDCQGSQYPSKYLPYTPLLCGIPSIKPDYSRLEPLWQSGLVHLSTKIVARFQFPAEPKFIFPIRDWESGCCPLYTVYYRNRGIFLHSWQQFTVNNNITRIPEQRFETQKLYSNSSYNLCVENAISQRIQCQPTVNCSCIFTTD